jgi:hypothetical protein
MQHFTNLFLKFKSDLLAKSLSLLLFLNTSPSDEESTITEWTDDTEKWFRIKMAENKSR